MSLRRNALLVILFTGVLAILGQWGPELARWWCLPAALLLLGLAYEAAVLARCTVHARVLTSERWPLGRVQDARCELRQESWPSLAAQVLFSAPAEFAAKPRTETLHLIRGVPSIAALQAAPRRLGEYRWPPPIVRLGAPFGLAWWPRTIAAECTVTVVPDLIERFDRVRGNRSTGEDRARTPGAGAEILQLRDYRHGDPLRVIDWKASARRRRLISRDRSEDQHLELIVAVDAGRASGLGAGEIDRLGTYVNVAARLAQRAMELDDSVGVLIFAARPLVALRPARGETAVVRIRETLAACRVQTGESNPVLAAARIRSMVERRSLAVFLTDLEDASSGEQLVDAVQLLTPKHFPFIAGLESAQVHALAQARVGEPLGAYRALAAMEYGNTVAANARALRALGAAALTARPEHLDRAVFEAYREFRERRRI